MSACVAKASEFKAVWPLSEPGRVSRIQETFMVNDEFFTEGRDDGKYKLLKPDSGRASAVADTQK